MLALDDTIINWQGWKTTLRDLRNNGWIFTQKKRYNNWYNPKDSNASHDYFYMRQPLTGMLARFKYGYACHEYICDFLTQETKRCREVRLGMHQAEKDFSNESISSAETTLDLLNKILLLQGNCKKKKGADIINIEEYLRNIA